MFDPTPLVAPITHSVFTSSGGSRRETRWQHLLRWRQPLQW